MSDRKHYTKVYDYDYFTGSQVFIYIGDVWVDEITNFSYQVMQQKTPIYGYASYLWDDCALGHKLVQGTFNINFKEQGYLWAVLRRYKDIYGTTENLGFTASKQDKALFKTARGAARNRPELRNAQDQVVGSNGTKISRTNIERIAQGDITRQERFKFYHDLSGYATNKVENPRDKAFEDIVEAFEDQIWDTSVSNVDLNSQLRNPDDVAFDGFDIYIVFGNYADKTANHTVHKIIDVRIVGQGKRVQVGGEPIQEQYNFIARTTA